MNGMETYNGIVRAPNDAIILFEACRIGLLPRVQRRLSEKERQSIKSGSVFVWDEREAGMRRWTDGKSWSASRVSGSFLTYREMEGKRGGGGFDKNANRDGINGTEPDSDGGGPDGYRYKPDGLMKQSFSIKTNSGQSLHLISYFSRSGSSSNLPQPSTDPQLRHIRPEKGMYPESTVHEQSNIPAVTRGPMNSPGGYTHAPSAPAVYGRAPYGYGPPIYPPSPMHTPPPHTAYSPYYQQSHGYPGHSPLQQMQYPPPPPPGYQHQPQQLTAFDRPPPPMANSGLPPPPPHQYGGPMPPQGGYQNGYPGYQNGYGSYQPPPLQAPQYPPPPQHHQQPQQQQQPPQQPQSSYDTRTPQSGTQEDSVGKPDTRQDSHHNDSPQSANSNGEQQQASTGAQPQPSSGQTIPSISAMLNAGENGQPPQRNGSKSPGSASRGLQDIPSHKLGFEASRDMQALRNLDKSTLKF